MRRSRGAAAPSERSGRVVRPRAWRRAIFQSLPRKEAVPRPARRKLPPPRRHGNPSAKTSRSRGKRPEQRNAAVCDRRKSCAVSTPPKALFLFFDLFFRALGFTLTGALRRDRLGLKERLRRSCGRCGGFLPLLAIDRDFLAPSEPLRLVGVARDGDTDHRFDFGM